MEKWFGFMEDDETLGTLSNRFGSVQKVRKAPLPMVDPSFFWVN